MAGIDVTSAIDATNLKVTGRRAYWVLSFLGLVHVSGEETDGRFCLIEWLLPPDAWDPLHAYRYDTKTRYVIEGEITMYLPGAERVLGPGGCFRTPVGVTETWHVTSPEPARILDISSPAGFDRFIAEVGRPAQTLTLPPPLDAPPDMDAIVGLAAKYGIDMLGPPGTLP